MLKNWKTTLAGLVAIVIQVGPLLVPKYITPAVAGTITAIAAALGLIAAKDAGSATPAPAAETPASK